MENTKGKFWLLMNWMKGICLPASVPPSPPTKGRWGPETGQGTHRERGRKLSAIPGDISPVLGSHWDGPLPLPSLRVLLPSHQGCLPSMSYTWKRNLSLSMGLPWMSRVSASCSSWRVMVPLPSESNRTKNLSAKKDCSQRRRGDGHKCGRGAWALSSFTVLVCVHVPWGGGIQEDSSDWKQPVMFPMKPHQGTVSMAHPVGWEQLWALAGELFRSL